MLRAWLIVIDRSPVCVSDQINLLSATAILCTAASAQVAFRQLQLNHSLLCLVAA
jgi:hypothetical protein